MAVSSVLPSRSFKKICAHNLSLQSKGDVLTRSYTVPAFCKKVMLLREHFKNWYLEMFPVLCNPVAKTSATVLYKNCQISTGKLTKNFLTHAKIFQRVPVGFEPIC